MRSQDAEDTEILWRESHNTYQPLERPLADFLATVQLTSSLSTVRPADDSPLLIFIEENCLKVIHEHANCDIRREQAGILCGQAYRDSGQFYLDIRLAIPVDTINSSTHFQFHERSWEPVWKQSEANSIIVGWYHTHPGHGIFLSRTDLRTQESYFAAPWQIAVVIDPISRQLGVFTGKGELLSDNFHSRACSH